jgi:hypothetical protein
MTELYAASSQWANRPADQRFWTLQDMRAACEQARAGSSELMIAPQDLTAKAHDGEMYLLKPVMRKDGTTGTAGCRMTHHAFGAVSRLAGAPGSYLRELPPDLAAQCLNAGIQRREDKAVARNWLMHKNGGFTLRAVLTSKYDRVWDADVCEALEGLRGWRNPAGRMPTHDAAMRAIARPATAADILPGQINISEGEMIVPSGLYASDHDMFAFLVAPDRTIDDGSGKPLMRGVFVRNSEVGEASLSMTFFLMQAVCGNHIVWNATGVRENSLRHIGRSGSTLAKASRQFHATLRTYHDAAAGEEAKIKAARNLVLGANKQEVLEALIKYAKSFGLLPLTKPVLETALTIAEEHESWYGNPRSLWGAVAGITHGSQGGGFADARNEVDRAAGKLLAMATSA